MKTVDENQEMARLLGRSWPLPETSLPHANHTKSSSPDDRTPREEYCGPLSFDRLSPIA